MSDNDSDAQALQGRGLRAMAFATLPIAFADISLWMGLQTLRGADPIQGLGNAATGGLVMMVAIGWACHLAASRHRMAGGRMPGVLYGVFGLVVLLACVSLIVSILAAALPCTAAACVGASSAPVTLAIVFGAIATTASINTIRFMLKPPMLKR